LVLALYAIEAHEISVLTKIAIGMLVAAVVLEAVDRRESRWVRDEGYVTSAS
jgi:hypothetical protein